MSKTTVRMPDGKLLEENIKVKQPMMAKWKGMANSIAKKKAGGLGKLIKKAK